MSEYGIKIRNIKAGTLYEYNLGVRDYYQSTQAMWSNSLFNDFLLKNGLRVNKNGATRDIVCIEFDFGSRSYEDEILHIEKLKEKYKEEGNIPIRAARSAFAIPRYEQILLIISDVFMF